MCMRSLDQLIRIITCAAALLFAADAAMAGQGRASERFRGLDRNGDGVITRGEWRGNDRSFGNHDWNRDGVLSGDEVRSALVSGDADQSRDDSGAFSDWTEDRFRALDRDNDGRLTQAEWAPGNELFARLDVDGDRTISRREFLGLEYGGRSAWTGPDDQDDEAVGDRFGEFDRNYDGVITMNEWPGSEMAFRRRDADRSGAIERNELAANRQRQEAGAYQRGYERGLRDGRQAGQEDKTRRNRWDLEGQRELESADAGYTSSLGLREDYQAGYRAGFRVGYGEGFNRE